MRVTLNEIAQITGLSKSTISRVVTGVGYVKQDTRLIVEKALQKTGYSYRRIALKKGSACENMILAISRDISTSAHIRYLKSLMHYFVPRGYMVFAVDCGLKQGMELDYVRYASQNGFCGIFLLSYIGGTDFSDVIEQAKCPVVLVNHYPRTLNLDVVSIDNYKAGHMAANYLLEHGHQNVAILAGPEISVTTRNRIFGFTDEFRDAGIEFPEINIYRSASALHNYDDGFSFAKKIANYRGSISAIFATNTDLAYGFVEGIKDLNLRIPEDFSVICTDNIPEPVSGLPSITTVCHSDTAIATAAAEMLLERIKNPTSPKRHIIYSPVLVEGNSVSTIKPT